jgi:hypothetical protein
MSPEESAPLLEFLFTHQIRSEFTCRFRWTPGALAIWDNRCAQHYAINDYAGHRRIMQRITLAGDLPGQPKRAPVSHLIPLALLILATTLEAGGDAIIRVGLRFPALQFQIVLMLVGAVVLYGDGLTLNLAPLDWGRLIGAYTATFFVIGQIINLVAFRTTPTLPIMVGGLFIVAGGAIITLWQRELDDPL